MFKNNSVRFRVNFESKWLGAAAFMGGLGFFLLCVYYFGFVNLFDCNIIQILFFMLVPMVALGGMVVLLHVMRYDAAQLIVAAAGVFSLIMLIRSFTYGSMLSIIVGVVWYAMAAIVCLLTLIGFFREKRFMVAAMLIPAVFRIVFVDLFQYVLTLSFISFVQELAMLAGLACFGITALCFEPVQAKRKSE